jgi:hypothetical protein
LARIRLKLGGPSIPRADAGMMPAALILGSSRAMEFNPDQVEAITGMPTFNFSASGGSVLDCVTILRYACRSGMKPRLILMNIDAIMLSTPVGVMQVQLAGDEELFQSVPRREQIDIVLRILQGINLESTWRNIVALATGDRARRRSTRGFLDNGLKVEFAAFRQKQKGIFDLQKNIQADLSADDVRSARNAKNELVDPYTVTPRNAELLLEIFDLARENDCQVMVVSTPEHPDLAATPKGRQRQKLLDDLRELVSSECQKRGFIYRDFSDLASFGGVPDDFWDSTHQSPRNVQRMINVLFDRQPDAEYPDIPTEEQRADDIERKIRETASPDPRSPRAPGHPQL